MKKSVKIQRLSTVLEYGCYAVILVSIGLCAYVSWGLYASPEETLALYPSIYRSLIERFMTLQGIKYFIMLVLTTGPVVLRIYSYWRLGRMFAQFRRHNYFTLESANHLFVFAMINFWVFLFATPLYGIADFIATIGTAEKPYGMPLIINGDELSSLVVFGSFMVISWIIREGVRLREENEEFL